MTVERPSRRRETPHDRPHAAAERALDQNHVARTEFRTEDVGEAFRLWFVSAATGGVEGAVEVSHQRTRGEDEIDPGRFQVVGEFGVPALRLLSELQHVAEHGEPAPARRERRRLGECRDSGADGCRARVVALVDQLTEAACDRNAVTHAPARARPKRAERGGRALDRCAGGMDTGQHGHAVQRPVPA